jgi:hypothetical protein
MIRGVDRKMRKAIKDAARAEGVAVGTWVRRSLLQALDAGADGPLSLSDLNQRLRELGTRLSLLERTLPAGGRARQVAARSKSAGVKRGR